MKEKEKQLREEIKRRVPNETYEEIVELNEKRKKKEQDQSRIIQRDKCYKLKYRETYEKYHGESSKNNNTKKNRHNGKNLLDKSK